MNNLIITSPAFEANGWIPNRNSGYGEDISPELHIEGLLPTVVTILITFDDLDHPISPGYNHWVAWNIPPLSLIPEGLPKGDVYNEPFHIEQGIAYGRHCYRGPKPPFNWNHEYQFTVYALDNTLSISPNSDKKAVLKAAEGHILQTGKLKGKYQRKHKD